MAGLQPPFLLHIAVRPVVFYPRALSCARPR